VVEVLSAMTGATGVQLLLWSDDRQDWLLPAPGGGAAPISGSGQERAVPPSVLRYAQRTGEPLLVADVTGDDRFARDPYFTDLTCCSLLALPILSRGRPRAVLLLENRLIRSSSSPANSPSPSTTPRSTPSSPPRGQRLVSLALRLRTAQAAVPLEADFLAPAWFSRWRGWCRTSRPG
jgi:hypothetical protein